MEQATVLASLDLVDDTGLEIDEDGAGDVLALQFKTRRVSAFLALCWTKARRTTAATALDVPSRSLRRRWRSRPGHQEVRQQGRWEDPRE